MRRPLLLLLSAAVVASLCTPLLDDTLTATRQSYDCPPNPNISGVEYRCFPGAGYVPTTPELGPARNHRGIWCNRHPIACPNTEYIAVDPVLGDPYCSLANEIYNRSVGKEVDPNGDCPPKRRTTQTTKAEIPTTSRPNSTISRPSSTKVPRHIELTG